MNFKVIIIQIGCKSLALQKLWVSLELPASFSLADIHINFSISIYTFRASFKMESISQMLKDDLEELKVM